MSNALATTEFAPDDAEQGLALQLWGRERLEVLKEQIAPGASDAELDLFATVCKRTRLDPFAKQIWSIQRRRQMKDARGQEFWQVYQVIQIGVHGLRLIAQRSREYAGQRGPLYTADGKEWTEIWLDSKAPAAAKVGVMRKGFPEPVWSVAVWDRAVQKDRQGKPMALWATRGPEQLALAAERDALRRAFPIETSDVEVVVDDAQERANADRYAEIFGADEDHSPYELPDRVVDRRTGEVLVERPSARELTDSERLAPAPAAELSQPAAPSSSGYLGSGVADKYRRNRELVARARQLGVDGLDVLKLGAADDVVDAANLELKDRIARAEWEQSEVERQRKQEGLI